MDTESQRPKERGGVLSSLNVAIDATNLAKEISSITPAKAVFGTVSVLLTMIRDSMANELDYVELGLSCAKICGALDRGLEGRRMEELSQSVCDAINQLTTTVAEIQRKVIKRSGRNPVSRLFHAKDDARGITGWKSNLQEILHIFNTELAVNTHKMVADIHQNMSKTREDAGNQNRAIQHGAPGESPPPAPRAYFGRSELTEKIVDLAESLTPIALIGVGGIGKTSTALTVLHDDRIKQRFGENRRFIRCDQFSASLPHFLHRLSIALGAGVENPEDLTPLRPFLSSRKILLVLDNAESILDPRGTSAKEIYAVVEELAQFSNVCLCITSRISIVPPACESLDIPTLSIGAAQDTFYGIYKRGERSDPVNSILEQLDFHPLSITLLATVAHHNKWDADRLTKEWGKQRTAVLHTQHDKSLAATIELSLASPMFQELGPDARDLLEVIAFFPQGVNENHVDWLFPTLSNITNIFDNFCSLSVTYRSDGFVTMLAPLRDHLYPTNPRSSQLLCTMKDCYSRQLSVHIIAGKPGFEEARWITSEDANVEHLLDVFTSGNTISPGVWDTCGHFMEHLYWHKSRPVLLGPRIEELPDDHPSKPQCLLELSRLLGTLGNDAERKRLLCHTLKLWRGRGEVIHVARTSMHLSDVNGRLGLHEEGVPQAREAFGIYERLCHIPGQMQSLRSLACSLYGVNQLDAAEEAASRALDLSSNEDSQFEVSHCHYLLGMICRSKGGTEAAINHLEVAIGIASRFNFHDRQFWCHYSLAQLFSEEGRFGDAYTHIEHSKSHAVNDAYNLGNATHLHADILRAQGRFEEAKSEVSCAAETFERLGAAQDLEECRELLRCIQEEMNDPAVSHELDSDGQNPE